MMFVLISCVLFMAVGVGLLYLVLRKNASPIPRGGLQWMVTIMCLFVFCLSGLIIILTWTHDESSTASIPLGPVEPFEFTLLSTGEEVSLNEFSGNVILLNFWATWCQPCITELPELDSLQVAYRDQGLLVLTVSDESQNELQRYSDLLPDRTISGYVQPETLPQSFQSELALGRPITYIIDGQGTIQNVIRGAGDFQFFEGLVTPWLADLQQGA